MARRGGLHFLLCLIAAVAASCAPGPRVVDPYGPQALALLREAADRVQLGKTTLKDVAPHLSGVQRPTSGVKDGAITGPPHLYVQDITVNGRFFGQLGFDAADRLDFFAMRGAQSGKRELWAMGALRAPGRHPHYWVTVRKRGTRTWPDESREYDENLLLERRTIYTGPFFFEDRLYTERYVKGILYKRVHYGKDWYAGNSRASVDWFPLPSPDVLDEATLDRIVTEAMDPEAHGIGERAWDLLPLAGGRAVPVISRHLRSAAVALPEHWVHLLSEIASPDAVRLLLSLLDHKDVPEYCRPSEEVARRWETSRPAIVEALKAPKASARVKRFCVEVLGLSKDATVVPLLAEALKDEATCPESAWALVCMDCPEAQAAIREGAKSHMPHVRKAIEEAAKAKDAF